MAARETGKPPALVRGFTGWRARTACEAAATKKFKLHIPGIDPGVEGLSIAL